MHFEELKEQLVELENAAQAIKDSESSISKVWNFITFSRDAKAEARVLTLQKNQAAIDKIKSVLKHIDEILNSTDPDAVEVIKVTVNHVDDDEKLQKVAKYLDSIVGRIEPLVNESNVLEGAVNQMWTFDDDVIAKAVSQIEETIKAAEAKKT